MRGLGRMKNWASQGEKGKTRERAGRNKKWQEKLDKRAKDVEGTRVADQGTRKAGQDNENGADS